MKKFSLVALVCFPVFFTIIRADQTKKIDFSFLSGSVNDFIARITSDTREQQAFMNFYNAVNRNLRQKGNKRRKQGWYHFNAMAMERMPIEHPEWYAQIKPFITNPNAILDPEYDKVRKAIRFFMTRYGAYQEFVRHRQPQHAEQTVVVKSEQQKGGSLWNAVSSSIAYVNDSFKSGWQYMRSKISA